MLGAHIGHLLLSVFVCLDIWHPLSISAFKLLKIEATRAKKPPAAEQRKSNRLRNSFSYICGRVCMHVGMEEGGKRDLSRPIVTLSPTSVALASDPFSCGRPGVSPQSNSV